MPKPAQACDPLNGRDGRLEEPRYATGPECGVENCACPPAPQVHDEFPGDRRRGLLTLVVRHERQPARQTSHMHPLGRPDLCMRARTTAARR